MTPAVILNKGIRLFDLFWFSTQIDEGKLMK
jgi:hypothetical protein